jgi:hypothetical protein
LLIKSTIVYTFTIMHVTILFFPKNYCHYKYIFLTK